MNDSTSLAQLTCELLEAGRAAEAEPLLCKALEERPDDGRLRLLLARVRHRLGDFRAASAAFEHAATLVPLDGAMQCLLADCYARIGMARQALTVLRLLFEGGDCPNELLPRLATGFSQLGDAQGALDVCRLAAQRQPEQAEAHFAVAFYLRRLGYPAAVARPPLERALALAPHHPVYRSNLAFLLVEEGRADEAYELLRELPPEACVCSCQLRRMMRLFQTLGDHERWSACALRLRSLRGRL
ncbi:MAG: tetratricopeptide repeat protein [Pirellulales bacterium]